MIGDTPYDVVAAGLAGVPSIALRCGGWPDVDLAGASEIFDDAASLLNSYDDSSLAALRAALPYARCRISPVTAKTAGTTHR